MTARPRPTDNRGPLVRTVVAGRVAPARLHPELIAHDTDGRAFVLPGSGGIHPAVHMGDLVDAWIGDHLLPGASAEDAFAPPAEPGPFHLLACIGNRAFDATGRPLGVVAGKRGGLAPGFWPPNLLAIEASRDLLMTLSPGDGIRIEAEGRGLALDDFPDVAVSNVSPRLLDALPLETDGTRLVVEVSLVVPSRSAGSGLGQDAWVGDLEIADQPWLAGTERALRFGDLVAFDSVDARTARFHRPDHVAVGLVVHGPGHAPGHGIGVTILLSGPAASLSTRVVSGAGLGGLLNTWGAET